MKTGELGRRERRRLETVDEIVDVSRTILRSGDELSLRSVAQKMGFTAPAMYRYVDSVDSLHTLVARDVFGSVVSAMRVASDRYPDDPAAQLAATATAFRTWSLSHRPEFRLVFANPIQNGRRTIQPVMDFTAEDDLKSGAHQFSDYFVEIFINLTVRKLISVPDADHVDDALQIMIDEGVGPGERRIIDALGLDGPGTLWMFKLAWARLYGVVMLEVFELIERPLIDSGSAFIALMRETFVSLGLVDSWDRLAAVSREIVALQS